jgi:glycosyltransferase involved in cell wall biosynthesis
MNLPLECDGGPLIYVVIPLFNEHEGVDELVSRLKAMEANSAYRFHVMFVDDHSSDRTPELLQSVGQENANYDFIRLSRNSGSHVAILAGLEHARGDAAVFMASDLQDPPELIPEMIDKWRAGNHVVWAVRQEREGVSWSERALARVFYFLLIRVARIELPPQGADFALLDRTVIQALLQSVGAHPSLGGDIARLGFRQAQIPYVKQRRRFGRSKWTLTKKLIAFADAFVALSHVPLRAMSYTGILFSIAGFIYATVVVLIRLLTDKPTEGWASLMVVVLILCGIQMIMLGVLGEYLWRTLGEARKRPRYFLESPVRADVTPSDRQRDSA